MTGRASEGRELAVPGVKPRTYHRHACGHYDVCLLSDEDAVGSDCRKCRIRKFNAEQAGKASKPPALFVGLGKAAAGLIW